MRPSDTAPRFSTQEIPEVPAALRDLLPEQGSFELQNDQASKTHSWHRHSLDEELFALSGSMLLFWVSPDGSYQEKACPEGTWITLPAGTVHGSMAGPDGAVYMIRPEGGQSAETVFLDEADFPFPLPTYQT